jgi:NADH-quinone oxidoreductase subunit J
VDLQFILFFVFGTLAIASASATVLSKNPVVSAMALVFHFCTLACVYFTLNAQFVGALQVLVYAGAIMILVIFVIMLLNLGNEKAFAEKFNYRKGIAILLGASFIIMLATSFLSKNYITNQMPASSLKNGTVEKIGLDLFTSYIYPFEAIALLLCVAVVGAIILAKKKISH